MRGAKEVARERKSIFGREKLKKLEGGQEQTKRDETHTRTHTHTHTHTHTMRDTQTHT